MASFSAAPRRCLYPYVLPGHRNRPIRSADSFQICYLSKKNIATIAVSLVFLTLLLVVFAYQGGNGVGAWLYSLLVVVSGMVLMVFGPILLCRFILHAYYRETSSVRTNAASQTTQVAVGDDFPQMYTCFFVPPETDSNTNRGAPLPTYEEALEQSVAAESEKEESPPPSYAAALQLQRQLNAECRQPAPQRQTPPPGDTGS